MSMRPPQRSFKKVRPTYSRFGTFIVISLFVFSFIVVPIKLLADESWKSAVAYVGLGGIFLVIVAAAFLVPVTQREQATYTVRPPMELDPLKFDPTRDGLPW